MDKSTGKPLLVNDEEIHAETIFVPDSPSGEVIVSFTFDSRYIKTDTDIVVFESLYRDRKEFAVHADLEDQEQTVTVRLPPSNSPQTGDTSRIKLWIALAGTSGVGGLLLMFSRRRYEKQIKRLKKED